MNQIIDDDYRDFITDLKRRVREAQATASRVVNRELIMLYWDIGSAIVQKQRIANWGDSVAEQIASDLRAEFPDSTGFSGRNVRDMRRLFVRYSDPTIWRQLVAKTSLPGDSTPIWRQAVAELSNSISDECDDSGIRLMQQLVAQIPWGHNLLILNKLSDPAAQLFYLHATAQNGWSRAILINQIKSGAYERSVTEGKSHNFAAALPEALAAQAAEMMKSRYNLGFLGVEQAVKERDLENLLIDNLQRFLLELGYGFCFIGRQYRMVLGTKEYYVDLLFYHRFLKALVAFDLKIGEFQPEHAGKMDFYLNVLNDQQRGPDDGPSIGIILCAEKSDIEVEYALKSKANPIGVAQYELQAKLPSELEGKLPTAEQLATVVRRSITEMTDPKSRTKPKTP
jgi:predicted nuclease of restriction endonuclease-like (RecB) superfamily